MAKIIPARKSTKKRHVITTIPLLIPIILILSRHLDVIPRFSKPSWEHPLSITEPVDRSSALITQIPEELPNGLGHRLAVINFELLLARALSVRYIHRFAEYDSLTTHDPLAVDKLFGWDVITDSRKAVLQNCEVERRMTTECMYRAGYPVCAELKKNSRYDRLVNIPDELVDCIPDKGQDCWEELKKWAAGFGKRTLFQMSGTRCHEDYLVGNFNYSQPWFRNFYWNGDISVELDEKRFQIGVHIRRGDFLNDSSRVVIRDEVYKDVVCGVRKVVDEVVGDVGTDVHIFSEGVPKEGLLSRHHVDKMEKLYVTDSGEKVNGETHWKKMLSSCRGDIRVHPHIASDTVSAVRAMTASDVFVGSKSGLSVHVVDVLSRGVRIVPVWRPKERQVGEWGLKFGVDDGIVNWEEVKTCLMEMKNGGHLYGVTATNR